MGLLAALKQIPKPQVERIETPEWTPADITHVFVRAGTPNRRDAMESWWLDRKDKGDREGFRAVVAAFYLCDESGEWSFGKDELTEAIATLGNHDARPVQRIFDAASRLNHLSPEDEKELVKN